MGQRKETSALQSSFLETLLGCETKPMPGESLHAAVLLAENNVRHSIVSPSADELNDLFGFISTIASPTANMTSCRTSDNPCATAKECELEVSNTNREESQPPSLSGTPQWLIENCLTPLARIAAIYNSMREFEGLTVQENAEQFLASQVAHRLNVSRAETAVERELSECHRVLELLTRRLYSDVTNESSDEVNRYTETLVENALLQPYDDEAQWIRQTMEAAVRKCLADPSKQIYTGFIVSTLLRPFRNVVRQLLQANEIPFPERVLAQVRDSDYAKMMSESLQTLARLGLTAQTTTLAWQAARSGQSENALTPWIARRVDGAIAAIWGGYAIVEQRVIRTLGYALVATFDADKHITHQMTIAEDDIERAKQSLLAQGYRCGDTAYPQENRVVKVWCELCRGRDSGWWFGDEAGRVMVVIPYLMRRRLSYHKPLYRAVSQMRAWGYRFYYDDHTLYFLPSGVELPDDAFRNGDVAEHKGGE